MTKDELKALAKVTGALAKVAGAAGAATGPATVVYGPLNAPAFGTSGYVESCNTVYRVRQQGNGWVLTLHDVPVSVLEATETKGSRVGPEILGIVLHRLEEMIMKADGMWRNGR